jgi:uncharacterized protein YqjF (DUF2071 family)
MADSGNDFDTGILDITAHRPWPMPDAPWVMTQTWRHLLFAHWPIAADALQSHVPRAFEIDTFDGRGWFGIVPFEMSNVAPRGIPPIERLSRFPELNVRTYVRHQGVPGVYFFSLDADNRLVVAAARRFFHLPYFSSAMTIDVSERAVRYSSTRRAPRGSPASFAATYRAAGSSSEPVRGTLEYFLAERYCLFTVGRSGHVLRVEIHHPPWTLQPAAATFDTNTMATAAGLTLPDTTPLLHVAGRQDVVAWMPMRVAEAGQR